jgi:DNA-directed RNA polymerase subunit RPC12/RpoP
MEHSAGPPERQETVGAMRCKECGGDVFSVTNLEDQTPITCDRCGAVVGRWADVRALTHIPEKDVLEGTGTDIFGPTYRGVAELSLIGID